MDVVPKPTTPGAGSEGDLATEAAPAATWRGSGGASLRVIFGNTVLLKRSLLGFATGTARVRAGGLSAAAGNSRALAFLKRSRKGIVMR